MRSLPDDGWNARSNGDSQPPFAADWSPVAGEVVHVFTHFRLTLRLAATAAPVDESRLPPGEWWPLKSLDSAGLPTLFSKAAKLAIRAREKI